MTSELATWAPPSILAGVLLFALGVLWRTFARRLDKMETLLETMRDRMPQLATVEQLGRLGDRMDARTTNLAERIAVLEALERRKE